MTTLAEIRQKFPQYADLDDSTLADALHRKFYADMPKEEFAAKVGLTTKQRAWSDVPGEALRNAGSSAGNLVGNIVSAVTSPVQTAKNIGKVGMGALEKLAPYPEWAPGYDAQAQAERGAMAGNVGQFFKDRYGSVKGLKNTLATDPVGAAADAAAVLTGGGAVVGQLPGLARAGALASRAGSAVDPIQLAGKAAGYAGRGASHVLGMTTGAGSQPIQTAFEAGRRGNMAFPEHMRGQAPMEQVIDMAESGVGALKRQRSAQYGAGMQSTNASQAVIDYVPIRQTLSQAFKDITYAGRAKDQAAAQVLQEMADQVSGFERLPNGAGMSAQGLDALKQALGEIRQRTQPGTMARRTADQVYNAVKSEITKQVPEYAATMRRYADASDQINELQRTFSISEKASPDTTLRKLQSTMRNNVNTNYGRRAGLLDELAQYEPNLPYALAGQALSSATPRGLQSITAGGTGIAGMTTNPMAIAALPAFSPRLMGEAAYAAGRGARGLENVAKAAGGSERIARALLAAYASGQVANSSAAEDLERALAEAMRRRAN